jgi:hypothetical protein
MTSERKIKANRANSRASTGPKTARGRVRTARNALRHALNLSIYSDPALSEEVELLAQKSSGPMSITKERNLRAASPKRRSTYAAYGMLGINSSPKH